MCGIDRNLGALLLYRRSMSILDERYEYGIGDRLRSGVDRGVDRGVELAERNPVGRVNCRLSRFSFSSGTEMHI